VEDNSVLPSNDWLAVLGKYTGPKVSRDEIVQAAEALQAAYNQRGYPMTSIAVAQGQIANGMVTFYIFQTAVPQIVVSGVRYVCSTNGVVTSVVPAMAPVLVPQTTPVPAPAPAPPPEFPLTAAVTPAKPASAADLAQARASLIKKMTALDTAGEAEDTRIHVVSTNAGPRFEVERYRIMGNSVLSPGDLSTIMTNIDGAYGTNVSIDGIRTVVEQLQSAYRDRGYVTVAVGLPQQKLTNATVKVQVTEGWLTGIDVEGNHYFSSNNVMRALPSLHTNILINRNILEGELNRANANQDRKIYPIISPGPTPGTSALTLHVKDQLPFHGKVDLDNYSSPGTPSLRVNGSAVYNNLWQEEHSVGVQYSFSPELYKPDRPDGHWNFYDDPQVVNYSVFYRLPLGEPASLADRITANPGTFGYSEATRKFNTPPIGATPDLTIFASRSAIDTGTANTFSQTLTTNGANPSINQQNFEHSPTINEDIAAHLDYPLAMSGNLQSSFSGGFDFKFFQTINYKTNLFTFVQTNFDSGGNPVLPPVTTPVPSPVPLTENQIEYLPLSLHYAGSWRDSYGLSTVALGLSVNLWYNSLFATTSSSTVVTTNGTTISTNNVSTTTNSHGTKGFQQITGSSLSSGHWVVLTPSYSRTIVLDDWTTSIRLDGQVATEPLISPEQFGAGGVNSVRGYPEGDAFGDDGWHCSLEQQTPVHTIGMVYGNTPLTVSASIYMDYAVVYLIDPQGLPPRQRLWGTGMGFTAAAGSHWQARFLFSFPLIKTSDTPAYEPLFNFSLTAQF
jgi:hemolysin activation/secretion protein